MLKTLELTNFRTHKHTVLEFDNITAIIGRNGSGKSNIFRALRMILLSKGFTEKDVRHGQKEASVKLTFTDGRTITRSRKGKDQFWSIANPNTEYFEEGKTVKDLYKIIDPFVGFRDTEECLQILPSKSNQYFPLDNTTPETLFRRLSKLLSSHGLETLKQEYAAELRTVKANSVEIGTVLEKQEVDLESLNDDFWEDARNRANDLREQEVKLLSDKSMLVSLQSLNTRYKESKLIASRFDDILMIIDGGDFLVKADNTIDDIVGAKEHILHLLKIKESYDRAKNNEGIANLQLENLALKIREEENKTEVKPETTEREYCPVCRRPY